MGLAFYDDMADSATSMHELAIDPVLTGYQSFMRRETEGQYWCRLFMPSIEGE